MTRRLYPLDDAARVLAVSKRTVQRLIGAGKIQSVSIGSRTLILSTELDRYITSLEEATRR